MKEMNNLAVKNEYFDKVDCKSLSDKHKSRALLMLIFMIIKRNCIIKLREVASGKA